MEKLQCKYHPSTPAQWECVQCNIYLCPSCVKREPPPSTNAICPVCNHYLEKVSLSNIIKPFWTKIPYFFTFPASVQSLIFILVMSLAVAILFMIPPFGPLFSLVVLLVYMRYAYAVLGSTAFGRDRPPAISLEMLTTEVAQPIKQVMVFIFIGLVVGIVAKFLGPVIAVLFYLLMIFCIPATVMIIAIENSFVQAINPGVIFSMITRIGWSYLLLCFFLFLLSIGSGALGSILIGKNTSPFIGIFILNFISMYFTLIMFSMMGYVLYQYHEELAFAVSDEFEKASSLSTPSSAVKPVNPELQHANILISEGKPEEAMGALREALRNNPDDFDIHDRYHKILTISQDTQQTLMHGRQYITQLMHARKLQKALDIFRSCYEIDPKLKLEDASHVHELAQYAMQSRSYKYALALLNAFGSLYPGHADVPKNYFLAAKVLSEGLRQDAKAKQLLENLIVKFPEHPLAGEIKQYLDVVKKLSNPT